MSLRDAVKIVLWVTIWTVIVALPYIISNTILPIWLPLWSLLLFIVFWFDKELRMVMENQKRIMIKLRTMRKFLIMD